MTKVDIPMKSKAETAANFIQNEKDVEVQIRAPKRVLHFSDGTMEEFSDEEQDQVDASKADQSTVDESKMNWSDWMLHKTCKLGTSVLAGCDYVGEGLASFLGITTPKYSFEIEEFKRMQAEQQTEDRAIQNFVEQNRTTDSGETLQQYQPVSSHQIQNMTNGNSTVEQGKIQKF
ncbi:protein FAM177A1 [Uranotaenia lowii]|uniref:protein FAM177A1 n=1 Tax=Uranotaenia lowii TaxID=190385 RepID=UPI0024783936|nr:protein FAM177A1 [Uranotaenia lowii]